MSVELLLVLFVFRHAGNCVKVDRIIMAQTTDITQKSGFVRRSLRSFWRVRRLWWIAPNGAPSSHLQEGSWTVLLVYRANSSVNTSQRNTRMIVAGIALVGCTMNL